MPPLASNAQAARAILLASATATTLKGSSRQQLREPGILLWLLARTLQNRMGSDHKNAPHVADALFRDRPELLLAAGRVARQSPIEAAKSQPERNAIGSATVATMADAPTMPIPGMLLSRLLASFERCSIMIRLSIDPIIVCTA